VSTHRPEEMGVVILRRWAHALAVDDEESGADLPPAMNEQIGQEPNY